MTSWWLNTRRGGERRQKGWWCCWRWVEGWNPIKEMHKGEVWAIKPKSNSVYTTQIVCLKFWLNAIVFEQNFFSNQTRRERGKDSSTCQKTFRKSVSWSRFRLFIVPFWWPVARRKFDLWTCAQCVKCNLCSPKRSERLTNTGVKMAVSSSVFHQPIDRFQHFDDQPNRTADENIRVSFEFYSNFACGWNPNNRRYWTCFELIEANSGRFSRRHSVCVQQNSMRVCGSLVPMMTGVQVEEFLPSI